MDDFVSPVDETKRENRDDDFSDGSNKEWTKALLAQVAEVRAQANAGKGEQKRPAGKIS